MMAKRGIRTKILVYFSAAMALVLIMVAVAFGLAGRQYSINEAKRQLEDAYVTISSRSGMGMGRGMRSMEYSMMIRQGNVLSDVDAIIVDKDLAIVQENTLTDRSARIVAEAAKDNGVLLEKSETTRVSTSDGAYFVKSAKLSDTADEYLLMYISIAKFQGITDRFQGILRLVILFALAITVVFVLFLSNSIVEPIYKLQGLSRRIGNGDFTHEDFNFSEKELADLNMSLNEASAKLSDYNEAQKTFFQNVSHELKTPLTSIEGYAEGIKYGVFTPEEASDVIVAESEKLNRLVEDILFLSKMESRGEGHQEMTRSFLDDIVMESIDRTATFFRKSGRELSINVLEKGMKADVVTEEILRALDNILNNAAKYSKSKVQVSLTKEGDFGAIRIRDDGDGISEKDLPHIFERFYKGTSGSHGIGLSIATTAVEKHGGTIEAENTGNGAVFTVRLPLA
jgi:signal transduction histidine kinase